MRQHAGRLGWQRDLAIDPGQQAVVEIEPKRTELHRSAPLVRTLCGEVGIVHGAGE